jgi:hypothetical protein
VDAEDLAWYNPEARAWEIETTSYEVLVGSSSLRQDLQRSEFEVAIPRS